MWLTFFGAVLVACVLLYVPGYFVLRALNFSPFVAVLAAPIPSIFFFIGTATILALSGVFCTGPLVAAIALALALMFYGAYKLAHKKPARSFAEPISVGSKRAIMLAGRRIPLQWMLVAAYVAFGLLIWCYVVLTSITGSPDAFFSRWDNQAHLNMTRSYIDSGAWSVFHSGYYLAAPPETNPFYSASATHSFGFYPAAWHIFVAAIGSVVGGSVPVCANALNLALTAIVYPTGMLLLLCVLFPNNNKVAFFGACIAPAFTAFPWGLFTKGPLFPQLFALSILPIFLSLFILYFEQDILPRKIFAFLALSCMGLLDLLVTQTNGIFAAYIFLAAYGTHYIYHRAKNTRSNPKVALLYATGFAAFALAFWMLCFNLPFLQDTINYEWNPRTTLPMASIMAASFAMPVFYPEPLLALCALVGLITCLRGSTAPQTPTQPVPTQAIPAQPTRIWWLVVPALIMALGFILDNASTSTLRRILTGFFYTDPFRSAALYAIFATPLTCLGAAAIFSYLQKAKDSLPLWLQNTKHLAAACVALFCVVTFMPTVYVLPAAESDVCLNTAFGSLHSRFKDFYRTDMEQVFSTEERAFVDQVLATIPQGALVINQPQDGSVFAYGTQGLNVYYRHCDTESQNEIGALIRQDLANYASNPHVQEAVEKTSAEYLLQLDQGVAYEDGLWMPQYEDPQAWTGIDAIRDSTPGFEVVLAQDDMRLYRIL